jgi:hypothetical protein
VPIDLQVVRTEGQKVDPEVMPPELFLKTAQLIMALGSREETMPLTTEPAQMDLQVAQKEDQKVDPEVMLPELLLKKAPLIMALESREEMMLLTTEPAPMVLLAVTGQTDVTKTARIKIR